MLLRSMDPHRNVDYIARIVVMRPSICLSK
jgi:hypothetical protein